MKLTIRRASPDDLPAITSLQAEAIDWLAAKGHDQWQPGQPRAPRDKPGTRLTDAIDHGTCWIAHTDADPTHPVASITIDTIADPEFWTPNEAPDALYIHRTIVRRDHTGHNLGAALLDWANHLAHQAGKPWLRLDAWRTNTALHTYYKNQGFTHVRTIDLPHRGSGALFQRPTAPSSLTITTDGATAQIRIPDSPTRQDHDHPTGSFRDFRSQPHEATGDEASRPSEVMRSLGIVQADDPRLRTMARPFTLPDEADEARRVIAELQAAAERVARVHTFGKGMGIAAPQIGIDRAAAIVRPPASHDTITLLNPRIIEASPETDDQYEGCLSFFDVRGLTPRPLTIHVEHHDIDGSPHITVYHHGTARLITHEIDHLHGTIYTDHMPPDRQPIPVEHYHGTGTTWHY